MWGAGAGRKMGGFQFHNVQTMHVSNQGNIPWPKALFYIPASQNGIFMVDLKET